MTPRRPQAPGGAASAAPAPRTGRRPGLRLLDLAITGAAARAAGPGGIRFTERQLYYETCRVLSPAAALLTRVPRTTSPTLRLPAFTRALEARGRETVAGLLPPVPAAPPVLPRPPAAPGTGEPDLYAYGLPRVLVCQDRSIARMLLANHVHLEAACLVLAAADALPLAPHLRTALERAEGATVHVLHDASPRGIGLPARIRAALGPVPGVRVSSIGLVPRHAAALRLPTGRGPAPAAPCGPWPPALRPQEAAWLARGRFAQVAAVPAPRLVRTVLRLTRGPRPPRNSLWTDLRGLRTTGFLTWPAS
ncbi:hypothetical protein OHA98_17515 [Streptomyces sp. NBC_00654]|uniref:hypothetical protein n=1 Tax=Streptomyces sp. NBC_00654 TaxID=2975799 RepID=UPI00224F1AAA|nr:hypothetical protein [Streptomyces sp. NBC_00654]MCX4966606.1 hypothetical protein [Streptomyces sp. NBC_00654]